MKKAIKVLGIILLCLALVLLARNFILKAAVSAAVKALTGLTLEIKSVNIGLFKPVFGIKGLKLLNPAEFPDPLMMDLPEVFVQYDPGAILAGKIHLPEIRLNLTEFVVVKNAQGKVNLDALTAVQQAKKPAETRPAETKPGPAAKPAKMPEMRIDLLRLDIGKVVFKDYSRGGQPRIKAAEVNIHETYTNIENPQAFVSLIVVKALANTTIAKLAGFDLGPLQDVVSVTLKTATKAVGKIADTGVEIGKDTAGAVSDTLKLILPFNKKESE